MSTVITEEDTIPTLGDLLERLGGIDPGRILLRPPPGSATEADLLRLLGRKERICELVECTLVEKCMGARESLLAIWLGHLLHAYLDRNDIGELFGEAGPFRLMAGLVRIPDLTFIRRERLPGGRVPSTPILGLAPDLAIEVLSKGNTAGEMRLKLRDYFLAGVALVWLIDPRRRTVAVHTAPDRRTVLTVADTLDGGAVLPGLALPVARIFERLPPEEAAPRPRRKKK